MRNIGRRICKTALLAVLGLGALAGDAQTAQPNGEAPRNMQRFNKERSPIAVSALSSGGVCALGFHGALSIVNAPSGQQAPARATTIKESLGSFTPLDMTSARLGDQDFLFVTMYWAFSTQSAQGNQGLVVQYSTQGQEVHKWSAVGRIFAGITADSAHQVIYLGSSNSGDISMLNVNEQGSPRTVLHVSGASMVGPLALDVEGQRLFAADVGGGSVYVADLAHHKSRLLVSGLGEPAALGYDPSQHKLYIADAGRHRISQVSVDAATPKVSDFFAAPELREPRGLSVGPDHSLWVADFESGTVLQLSPAGKAIATVRP